MTLHIDRFAVRCRASPQAQVQHAAIERIVREQFVEHCGAALGSAFHSHGGIVRIKRLNLRLRLERRLLGDAAFAHEWASQFALALRDALAVPTGGDEARVIRFENRAEWYAAVIEALLTRSVSTRWEFAEYVWLAGLPVPRAIVTLLATAEHPTAALRAAVQRGCGQLLMQNLDAAAIEQLCKQIEATEAAPSYVNVDELFELSERALDHVVRRGVRPLRECGLALAVWIEAQTRGENVSLRRVGVAFAALDVLVTVCRAHNSEERWERLQIAARDAALADNVRATLKILANMMAASAEARRENVILPSLLERASLIAETCPDYALKKTAITRVRSDVAAVLLLIPVVDRLGWSYALRTTLLWSREGPRVLTYFLADIARTLLNRHSNANARDIAAAIFAGWLDEPRWFALERFAASVTSDESRDLATVLQLDIGNGEFEWPTLIERASEHLLREFAAGVRGFRRASSRFIVRELLAVPGEIYLEEDRLGVVLDACPMHVALHVSGAFGPARAISWLGDRDVVFHPGGH